MEFEITPTIIQSSKIITLEQIGRQILLGSTLLIGISIIFYFINLKEEKKEYKYLAGSLFSLGLFLLAMSNTYLNDVSILFTIIFAPIGAIGFIYNLINLLMNLDLSKVES